MLESMEFQKPKVLKRSVQQEEWKLLLGKWKGKYSFDIYLINVSSQLH